MNYDDIELTKEQIHELATIPEQNDYVLLVNSNWKDYCDFIRDLSKIEHWNNKLFFIHYLPHGGRDLITEKELNDYE